MVKLSSYLRPYWKAATVAPLLMLLEVTMDLMQPTLMAAIVDKGVRDGDTAFILRTGGFMVLAALVGALAGMGCTLFSSVASISFATDLRRDLFSKVQAFSFTNLDSFPPASLITRLTNDVTQVQLVVQAALRMLVRAPLLCIGGTIMAVTINARLALILFAALPILGLALFYVIGKGFPLFATVQQKLDNVNEVMQENLAGGTSDQGLRQGRL